MLKIIREKKLADRFWFNVRKNSPNEIISLKPGVISKWIFPIYAGIVIITFSIVWFIHHPEIVMGDGVITDINVSGEKLWVEVDLQESNIKMIVPGQPVQLRFNDYPSAQFGIVKGSLQQVVTTQIDKKVLVLLALQTRLTTNQNKNIPYKKGVKVDILIIVKNFRLIEHILHGSSKIP